MAETKIKTVSVFQYGLRVLFKDGRELVVPFERFPRLRDAADAQRHHWRLIGDGQGIHWPNLDVDISVAELLRCEPPPIRAVHLYGEVSATSNDFATRSTAKLENWQASAVAAELVAAAGTLAKRSWIASNEIAPRLSAVRQALVAELLALNAQTQA